MVQPDLEDLLNLSYWYCEKCEAPFATKELAEKHELKCYVLEDIKEDLENLEKILEKTELNSYDLRKGLEAVQNLSKGIADSSAKNEIKSIINTAKQKLSELEETEEREDTRLEKLEKVKQREEALDFEAAIEIWEDLGEISEAARVRKLKAEMGSVKLSQKVKIRDSVLNRSNIGADGKSKAEQIKEIKDLLDSGAIDAAEFKQMKKEILGK